MSPKKIHFSVMCIITWVYLETYLETVIVYEDFTTCEEGIAADLARFS